jgi:UDP:flavonoid glycosyltransferase YjiC (YdhE family)
MAHGGDFFEAAAEASRLLGRRAVFLSGHREHLPSPLPPGVTHFDYVPFSLLLPRCGAVVHHGGIGTSAQALAAGVPQLVLPMNFDQFDNAARLVKLGVGKSLETRKGKGKPMAALLAELLGSGEVRKVCQEFAASVDPAASLEKACRIIENLSPQAP